MPLIGAVTFPRFQGRVQSFARAAWWGIVVLVVWMTLQAIPLNLEHLRSVCPTDMCIDLRVTAAQVKSLAALGISLDTYILYSLITNLVPPLISLIVAFILFYKRPQDGMAYFTSLTLIVFGGVTYPDFPQQLAMSNGAWIVPYVVLQYLGSISLIALYYLFPTGIAVPRWIRYCLFLWVVEQVFDVASSPPLTAHLISAWLADATFVFIMITIIYSQIYRYRYVSNAVQRRQTRWVVFGITLALSLMLVLAGAYYLHHPPEDDVRFPLILNTLKVLAGTLIPVSFGLAVLRSHLFDIDLLINRTLFYGTLTAIVAGVLAVSLELTRRTFLALTGQSSELAPMFATLIAVATFDPIKKRVQTTVDRHFKYPTRSFGEFGAKVRDFVKLSDPAELLTVFLREAMDQFDAQSGAVYLGRGTQLTLVQQVGTPDSGPVLSVPLECDDHQYGLITLGTRRNGDEYDDADRGSLEQMGNLIARSIRLARHSPAKT